MRFTTLVFLFEVAFVLLNVVLEVEELRSLKALLALEIATILFSVD